MNERASDPTVHEVAERSRFEIHSGGRAAGYATYRDGRGEMTFTHTEIDDEFEGRGLGGLLVRGALDTARAGAVAGVRHECR